METNVMETKSQIERLKTELTMVIHKIKQEPSLDYYQIRTLKRRKRHLKERICQQEIGRIEHETNYLKKGDYDEQTNRMVHPDLKLTETELASMTTPVIFNRSSPWNNTWLSSYSSHSYRRFAKLDANTPIQYECGCISAVYHNCWYADVAQIDRIQKVKHCAEHLKIFKRMIELKNEMELLENKFSSVLPKRTKQINPIFMGLGRFANAKEVQYDIQNEVLDNTNGTDTDTTTKDSLQSIAEPIPSYKKVSEFPWKNKKLFERKIRAFYKELNELEESELEESELEESDLEESELEESDLEESDLEESDLEESELEESDLEESDLEESELEEK